MDSIFPLFFHAWYFLLDARHLPVICWILQGASLQSYRIYACVTLSFPVLSPWTLVAMLSSDPYLQILKQGFCLVPMGTPFLCHGLDILSMEQAGATVGLPLFVSYFWGTIVPCWLILSVLKTIVSHLLPVFEWFQEQGSLLLHLSWKLKTWSLFFNEPLIITGRLLILHYPFGFWISLGVT